MVWDERHLKSVLKNYFYYYNSDRTHLGLTKETPIDRQVSERASRADQLVESPKVGGLHHRYEWRAAA
ncbi:MAG: IS3 family transposase [bacterium]